MKGDVFAFECNVRGTDWQRTINARSKGKAKADYLREVRDAWESVNFTDVTARKIGRPFTSSEFIRCAEYRGLPAARCGQAVVVGTGTGVIVGHNSSANFDVLFDDDSPEYAGQILNVHPASITFPERTNERTNEQTGAS